MVAAMLSDKRFAEIKKAVGNPFDNGDPFGMSPDEYLAKLDFETGSDDVLDQYLQKASGMHSKPVRASAEKWLKELTAIDFNNISDISNHRFALTVEKVDRFKLGNHGEDTFAVLTYPGAIVPDELSPERKYSGDYYPHTAFISLRMGEVSHSHLDPESSKAATLASPGQPPYLVLPIGQVQKKPKGETDDEFENTDYVLVIDAITTSHPVWLIYDRNAEDDLGEPQNIHPDEQPLVFKELGKNFDAVQVFPSIQKWFDYYNNLDFTQMLKSMQETGITGPIKAKEIAISEAKKLLLE
ncbi:hypothetical protein J7337_003538 [Fusarium musae]|uniref:Uncharacterized protein n=1 Tax=Fusarium musae TaxID=1042133 RepID=A0A9P8IS37_9HYPO|nr:hypothetical protein J7337_003538 [Fusarium musae]KAG9503587.1 hypothetical protein J7337_003538 [Fusarium musae]